MIAVTDRAKQELQKIRSDKVDNPQAVLRLVNSEQGLGLGVDIEMPGDKVVEHDGDKVLVVEEKLAGLLEGVTLDVEETAEGLQLTVFRAKKEGA
jgi:Fe-S cluster assembly iron-binding protein IscA